jgi:hypothetical protein
MAGLQRRRRQACSGTIGDCRSAIQNFNRNAHEGTDGKKDRRRVATDASIEGKAVE